MAEAVVETSEAACARDVTFRDIGAITGLFILLSAAYWVGVLLVCGGGGFPLDDSYIHLQFARNLYNDGLMAFNRGAPSSGSTAPLYPMLLAAGYALVHDWHWASYLLGSICSLGTALAVYGITRSWTGRADFGRWAGLLTAVTTPTIIQAYSGMESACYSLLFLAGLWCYSSPRRRMIASGIFAVCVWLRPEFMCLLPLILLERAITASRRGSRRLRSFSGETLRHVGVWIVILGLYAWYHWRQDGHLVPGTFHAKAVAPNLLKPAWLDGVPAALNRGNWLYLLLAVFVWPAAGLMLTGIGITINCAPLGFGLKDAIWALWRDKSPAASGWRFAVISLIGYPYLRAFVDSLGCMWFQQQRYYAHVTPLVILIVIGALPATGMVVNRRWWSWRGKPLSFQMRRMYQWTAATTAIWLVLSVLAVWNINSMQVAIGDWVRENTTPDQVIATNDIGAIAFVGERPVLDTIGLVEPGVVDHILSGGDLLDYLRRRDPAYVILFPNWYEDLSARRDMLEPVKEVRLGFNVVCGGSTMVVYRPRWNDVKAAAIAE